MEMDRVGLWAAGIQVMTFLAGGFCSLCFQVLSTHLRSLQSQEDLNGAQRRGPEGRCCQVSGTAAVGVTLPHCPRSRAGCGLWS